MHFYPEGSLWPYYEKIRSFKDGAFRFSVQNHVPIVPMVYTFQKSTSVLRYFKKKPSITLTILDAIYPDTHLDLADAIQKIKQETYACMENYMSK